MDRISVTDSYRKETNTNNNQGEGVPMVPEVAFDQCIVGYTKAE